MILAIDKYWHSFSGVSNWRLYHTASCFGWLCHRAITKKEDASCFSALTSGY